MQPLLAHFLFRSLAFLTANLTQLLVGISLIIALVTVPLMANTVMGKDPLTSALWLLRMTEVIPLGGLLLSVRGIRTVAVLGLAMVALGLLLVSTWNLDVAEPWLTLHLVIAGLGFGLVIAPIMAQALNAVHENYHATAASLVTVSRMLEMTLGLAALSAWGVGHFQALTARLNLPLLQGGEAAAAFQVRLDEYNAGLHAAGLSLFHNFFQVAAGAALTAILPALAMRSRK